MSTSVPNFNFLAPLVSEIKWGDMVDVITCAMFGDCRLKGVVRGVSLPSPIDLTRRPYNIGHTTM